MSRMQKSKMQDRKKDYVKDKQKNKVNNFTKQIWDRPYYICTLCHCYFNP